MSKEIFDKAIQFTLKWEGGYSNDPDDPGAETKYGISKRYHPNIDIKNLTIEQAKRIYYDEYWLPTNCEEFYDSVAIVMFDCAVNPGLHRAIQFLQHVIGVKEDGVIGPITMKAADNYAGLHLAMLINDLRRKYYQEKVIDNPIKIKYLRGWLNRCDDLEKYIREIRKM